MTATIYIVCTCLLIASLLLGFARLIKGPDALNRIVAFDLISICLVGIVIIFSERESSIYYIEIVLIFCLLGFASTVALMESLFRSYYKEKNR